MFGRLLILVSCLALAFPSFAALTGTVMNADGQPVAGALVKAYSLETGEARRVRLLSDKPDRTPLGEAVAAKTGRFSLDWPKDQAVTVIQIEANGYSPHSIRVERDDDVGALSLTLAAPKTGRITAAGKPVAGARVILADESEIISTTDAEGRYTLTDPSKWASRIAVIHRDYAILDEPARRGASPNVSLDRTLQRGVTLSGRVLGRDGKTAIAGAAVSLDGWPVAVSGENGAFTIAHAPEKWEWLIARTAKLTGRRARGSDGTIRLQPGVSFTGIVRDSKTSVPIAGAEVLLNRAGRFNLSGSSGSLDSTISDAKGNFTLADVAPGSYSVFAVRPGFRFEPVDALVADGARSLRTVLGRRLGRVAGTVINEQKQPVAGARVTPQQVARGGVIQSFTTMMFASAFGTTAPDGTFTVRVETDADLQIEARKKGFPPARTATLRVAEGERKAGIVITIPSGILVTGKVTNRDDQPLAGVTVTAADARSEGGGVRRMLFGGRRERDDDLVQSAADGTFALQVKEGTYDLLFRRDGFASKTLRGQEINSSLRPLSVTLEAGVEITGRVTRGGTPVAGVSVNAIGEGTMESTETGADGAFRLPDLTPGPMMLFASKPDEFIQHNRPITAPAGDVEIEVPAGGRIAGRVLDKETRAPITTFEAGLSGSRGGGGMVIMGPNQTRPFTSDDGSFVLENVPAGSTTLVVTAAGYTSSRIPTINVEEAKSTEIIEVLMDRGLLVSGRVTGPDGAGLSGVAVRHTPAGSRQMRMPNLSSGAVTDSNGDYSLESVEPGDTRFTFSRSGYVTVEKNADLKDRNSRVDAQLGTGIRVSGTVVTDSGSPVADATVMANSAAGDASSASTRTDQNGAFQLDAMAPGRYTFQAYKQGYPRTEVSDTDITTGAPVRLVLGSGGTIYGRVIGLTAEEMGTAQVTASNSNGMSGSPVDSAGNFRIEGAPTGTVRLVARTGQGFSMSGRTSPTMSVQVEAGASVQQDIEFKSDTVIRGRVTRDGQPVGNAMVSFNPRAAQAQTNARTQSDSSGYYEVTGLDDATYSVAVMDLQRNSSFSTTYEVKGSGNFDIDMRSTTVRGRVVDADTGQAVAEATIELREGETGGPRFAMRMVQSDASGAFVLESVPAGAWNIAVEKKGYGTRVEALTVGESPADVEIRLKPNPGVTLRVVDARDGRSLDSYVRVTDAQNRVVYDSPMRFGMGSSSPETSIGLEPGTYRVVVAAQNYATRSLTITSPGAHTVGMSPGGTILVRSKGNEMRRARLIGADGREYSRNPFSSIFTIDPSPGVTQLDHVAPGPYTLEVLGSGDQVIGSAQVTVGEMQQAVVEI